MQAFQEIVQSSAFDTVRPIFANNTATATVLRGLNTLSEASTRREHQANPPTTHNTTEAQQQTDPLAQTPNAHPQNRPMDTALPYLQAARGPPRRVLHLPPINHAENTSNWNEVVLSARGIGRLIATAIRTIGHEKHMIIKLTSDVELRRPTHFRKLLNEGKMTDPSVVIPSSNKK